MKIIIISDTHMPKKAKLLPNTLIKALRETDYILHLGDWQDLDLYDELLKYAPVDGVAGNIDDDEIRSKFGDHKIVSFYHYKIGLVHGHLGKGKNTEEKALLTFKDHHVDAVFYGHSHIPVLKKINETIVFNPGSPSDKRKQPFFSFGILELYEREFSLQHIFYESKI